MKISHLYQRASLLALYAAGVVLATLQRGVFSRQHTTFSIFRQSFTHLVNHQNLYAAYPAEQGAASVDLFKYSPSAAMLFAPLSVVPYPVALLAWNALNVGLLVYAILRLLPRAHANLALLLLAPELFVAIQSSSSNGLIAALILLSACAYEEGRLLRAGYAIIVGAAFKIFPLACFVLALPHARRPRTLIAALIAFFLVLFLPLIVISPSELLQQYRWWVAVELVDAHDMMFGMSLMRQLREWWQFDWPNWIVQLIGTAVFLLPAFARPARWQDRIFRLQYLCSLLIYVVLFNHQAERQSFIIAATGCVIWFVSGTKTLERKVLVALALIGVPTSPYLAMWLVMQWELLRAPAKLTIEGRIRLAEHSDASARQPISA